MSTDPTWPIQWFRDPGLTEPTPLTVTPDGRVFGHLCEWNRAHIGFGGRKVYPPRGDDMSYFLTGATDVRDDDGDIIEISVGKLTMNTGHASTANDVTAAAASAHYDNTGSIAALVNAGSDDVGIWMAGAMMPDLDAFTARRFRCCGASGDWRAIGGSLRLVAALSVPVGGFPIPRSRVASGAPLALVAAGALVPAASFGRAVDPAWEAASVPADKLTADGTPSTGSSGMRLEISDKGVRFFGVNGEEIITARPVVDPKGLDSVPSPATLAALIDERLDERREAAELAAAHAALAAEVDETPQLVASLLAATDDTPGEVASLLADLDDTPEQVGALLAALDEGAGGAGPKGLSV